MLASPTDIRKSMGDVSEKSRWMRSEEPDDVPVAGERVLLAVLVLDVPALDARSAEVLAGTDGDAVVTGLPDDDACGLAHRTRHGRDHALVLVENLVALVEVSNQDSARGGTGDNSHVSFL